MVGLETEFMTFYIDLEEIKNNAPSSGVEKKREKLGKINLDHEVLHTSDVCILSQRIEICSLIMGIVKI